MRCFKAGEGSFLLLVLKDSITESGTAVEAELVLIFVLLFTIAEGELLAHVPAI